MVNSSVRKLKNKQTLYVVMRHDFDGKDCVICAASTPERADELHGEFEQMFRDKGISEEESYFYVTGATYYD